MSKLEDKASCFSEIIPNPAGIPGQSKNSDKIRKGHVDWKMSSKKKKHKEVQKMSYWQKVSNCAAL
jgi:hypothetical protein